MANGCMSAWLHQVDLPEDGRSAPFQHLDLDARPMSEMYWDPAAPVRGFVEG